MGTKKPSLFKSRPAQSVSPIFRPTDSDREILGQLQLKLGLNVPSVIRVAIRTLAEQKGIAA